MVVSRRATPDIVVLPVVFQRDNREEIHFVNHVAPQHFALHVHAWFDSHFSDRWIER
jgi:hypothetical protein